MFATPTHNCACGVQQWKFTYYNVTRLVRVMMATRQSAAVKKGNSSTS